MRGGWILFRDICLDRERSSCGVQAASGVRERWRISVLSQSGCLLIRGRWSLLIAFNRLLHRYYEYIGVVSTSSVNCSKKAKRVFSQNVKRLLAFVLVSHFVLSFVGTVLDTSSPCSFCSFTVFSLFSLRSGALLYNGGHAVAGPTNIADNQSHLRGGQVVSSAHNFGELWRWKASTVPPVFCFCGDVCEAVLELNSRRL